MDIITTTGFASKIITTIGINAVCSSITTITSAARSIGEVINGISRSSTPDKKNVIDLLNRLDLEETIKVVDSMLKEISRDNLESNTLQLCLDSLIDILKKIEFELKRIDYMLKYNSNIWILSSFRSHDCTSNMKKIEEYKNILDVRLKRFVNMLKIKEEFSKNETKSTVKEDLVDIKISCEDSLV